MTYKFSKKHKDMEIARIQIEAEDNFATRSDVNVKADIVTTLLDIEPTLTDMIEGEIRYYDDGTNQWFYKRVGGRLFKLQLTEV